MRADANMEEYLRNAQIPEYSDEEEPGSVPLDELGEISAEDTSIEDGENGDHLGEQQEEAEFDPLAAGLKEISNLGKFTVSSHKPGNGVDQLRNDSLKTYWQYVALIADAYRKKSGVADTRTDPTALNRTS